jgi:hypothetical protein
LKLSLGSANWHAVLVQNEARAITGFSGVNSVTGKNGENDQERKESSRKHATPI